MKAMRRVSIVMVGLVFALGACGDSEPVVRATEPQAPAATQATVTTVATVPQAAAVPVEVIQALESTSPLPADAVVRQFEVARFGDFRSQFDAGSVPPLDDLAVTIYYVKGDFPERSVRPREGQARVVEPDRWPYVYVAVDKAGNVVAGGFLSAEHAASAITAD